MITMPIWVIPAFLTLACGVFMLLPEPPQPKALGVIDRILWLIPIGFIWAIYFGCMYCFG